MTARTSSSPAARLVALEVAHHDRVHHLDGASEDLAGGAVDRDQVTFGDDGSVGGGEAASREVDVELVGAAYARTSHPAGHDGGVRGLAAATRQDALGGHHAREVVGGGRAAYEDDVIAPGGPLDRGRRVEDGLADGRARRGVHAGADLVALGGVVEAGEHQLRQLRAGDPVDGFVEVDDALLGEGVGDAERRLGRTFADAGLQHPELAVLDGELDVAQVGVVVLEAGHDRGQLVVCGLVDLLQIGQRDGVADAGDDVLALRVDEVVAIDALRAGGRVAGERDAGARVVSPVAVDHRADVDGGAEVVWDLLLPTVERGAVGVPRGEDGQHGHVELFTGVLREPTVGVLADQALVGLHESLQVFSGQVEVGLRAALGLERIQRLGEHARLDVQHGAAEHLQQPAVGVVREPLAAANLGQALDRLVVEADIEDRFHHPGHGELRAGPYGHQQRVLWVAERLASCLLQRLEVLADLVGQPGRLLALGEVGAARVGADDEPRRNRHPQTGHLREIGPLAAQEVLLIHPAFAEVIHILGHAASMTQSGANATGAKGPALHLAETATECVPPCLTRSDDRWREPSMSKYSPYSRRKLRALFRTWTSAHRRLILTICVGAIGLIIFETAVLWAFWHLPARGYVLGALHMAIVAGLIQTILSSFFAQNREAIGQLRGAWGEDNTRAELKRAKRKSFIWGSVDSVNLQAGDIDHFVVTRNGGLVAIDSKWRSESFTDRDEMARSAVKVRMRAEALTRTLLVGERGAHRARTNPLNVRPVIVLWGLSQRELPDGAQLEGIDFVAGRRLVAWLAALDGGAVDKDAANDLLDRLEDFRANAWISST